MTDPSDPQEVAKGQPLIEHLIELRSRLLKIAGFIFIVFVPLFFFANDIYSYVSSPLRAFLPEGATMIATEVASPFLTPFKLALVLAIFMAIPFILHQIWAFVAPGLYASEKRLAGPLLASSIVLFYAGMAFAYFVVFPLIFAFFTSIAPEGVTIMTDINQYLDFVLKLFFAFGIAFEIPIATLLLIWSGATTTEKLKEETSLCDCRVLYCGYVADATGRCVSSFIGHPHVALIRGRHHFRRSLGRQRPTIAILRRPKGRAATPRTVKK